MQEPMFRARLVMLVAATAAALAATAMPALAAGIPPASVIRVDRPADTAAFARVVEATYDVQLQRIVAADIDRDGDLDIVAATGHSFLVWVNDGDGRLTSQSPRHDPIAGGTAPAGAWQDGLAADTDTIQDDAPSQPVLTAHAHAPPAAAERHTAPTHSAFAAPAVGSTRVPRAPPSH
jgi:FG-GAP-like repeat